MRVSLSDWLAFQARIRGSKDPRLLRDRPSDGAAFCAKMYAGVACQRKEATAGIRKVRGDGSARREMTVYARGTRVIGSLNFVTFCPAAVKNFFVPLPCKKARGGQWHGPNDNVPDRGGKL